MRSLTWNATRCPTDKTVLLWAAAFGMRVYVEVNGRKVYNARCPRCGEMYSQARRGHP